MLIVREEGEEKYLDFLDQRINAYYQHNSVADIFLEEDCYKISISKLPIKYLLAFEQDQFKSFIAHSGQNIAFTLTLSQIQPFDDSILGSFYCNLQIYNLFKSGNVQFQFLPKSDYAKDWKYKLSPSEVIDFLCQKINYTDELVAFVDKAKDEREKFTCNVMRSFEESDSIKNSVQSVLNDLKQIVLILDGELQKNSIIPDYLNDVEKFKEELVLPFYRKRMQEVVSLSNGFYIEMHLDALKNEIFNKLVICKGHQRTEHSNEIVNLVNQSFSEKYPVFEEDSPIEINSITFIFSGDLDYVEINKIKVQLHPAIRTNTFFFGQKELNSIIEIS